MVIQTEIHTLRHAHTKYNAEKRYAGTIDVPLNDVGIQSTQKASKKLAEFKFDIIITSTMKRSIETARYLVGSSFPLIHSKLCNERNFGIMEGLTWDEVQNLNPPVLMINVGDELHTVNPKGGEPFEDLWQRAKKFRCFIFKRYKGLRILVISHGVFLQMFHGVLRGSNCIESLGNFPSNLQLCTFFYTDNKLTEEKNMQLIQIEDTNF